MKSEIKEIKEIHGGDFKDIWKIAGGWKSVLNAYNLGVSISVSIIFSFAILIVKPSGDLDTIIALLQVMIPFYGALVAISVSGFIMIVTFNGNELDEVTIEHQLNKIKKKISNENPKEEEIYSFLQKATGKYALIVFLQLFITLILIVAYLYTSLNVVSNNHNLVKYGNFISLFTLIFISVYGVFLCYLLMKNTFIISQAKNQIKLLDLLTKEKNKKS
jgi:hypothetical protein